MRTSRNEYPARMARSIRWVTGQTGVPSMRSRCRMFERMLMSPKARISRNGSPPQHGARLETRTGRPAATTRLRGANPGAPANPAFGTARAEAATAGRRRPSQRSRALVAEAGDRPDQHGRREAQPQQPIPEQRPGERAEVGSSSPRPSSSASPARTRPGRRGRGSPRCRGSRGRRTAPPPRSRRRAARPARRRSRSMWRTRLARAKKSGAEDDEARKGEKPAGRRDTAVTSNGPTRSGSSQGIRLPIEDAEGGAQRSTGTRRPASPRNRPRSRSRGRTGRENTSSAVPRSKSRSADVATKATTMNAPITLMLPSMPHDDVGRVAVEAPDARRRSGSASVVVATNAQQREDAGGRPEERLAELVAELEGDDAQEHPSRPPRRPGSACGSRDPGDRGHRFETASGRSELRTCTTSRPPCQRVPSTEWSRTDRAPAPRA